MHRAATLGNSYRRIVNSVLNSKPHQHGHSNFVIRLGFFQNQCCRECGFMPRSSSQNRSTRLMSKDYDHFEDGKPSTTKVMQMQIINALRLGDRSRASSLLLDLSHVENSLEANDLLDILQYCSRTPDPFFVGEIWRLMLEKEIRLNNECYELMAQALCNGGYLEEAFQLMCLLRDVYGFYKSLPVYNTLLDACSRVRSIHHSTQCLDQMERQMIGKNEITYSMLLKMEVWKKNLSTVRELWKDYIKHYSLSLIPLLKFLQSFSRLGDSKSAYLLLQHMVALAKKRSDMIYKSPEGRFNVSRLDIPIPSKKVSEAEKYFVEADEQLYIPINDIKIEIDAHKVEQLSDCGMGDRGLGNAEVYMRKEFRQIPIMMLLRLGFNELIHASVHAKDYALAEKLFLQMQNLRVKPSRYTYDGIVKARIFKGDTHGGMEILKLMQVNNIKPYDSTLAALSTGCSRDLELDRAEEFLDKISDCAYPHPFNSFLEACHKMNQPERAIRMMKKMNRLKIQPDIKTYEYTFSVMAETNIPYYTGNMQSRINLAKNINALEMHMANNGIQHSLFSMLSLLKALGAEGMIKELLQYFRFAEQLTLFQTPIYNCVLDSLVRAKASHTAIEVFKNMKFKNVAPDAGTYNIMINCCGIIRSFKSALALISVMIRDGYYPHSLIYAILLKILLENDSFDEALDLLDQAVSEECLDVVLYNTILNKACKEGNMDVTEFVVEHMHQQKIQPNLETVEHVFSAYVNGDYRTTAVEALEVLSMRMLSEEDGALKGMMTDLESFIFSEDLEQESLIPQFYKKFEEERACALLNLRWCAIMGSPISWSTSESDWAKRLTAKYNMSRVGV